ncbi:MAG TPA: aspartate aminotransferase family protein [Blastocatellia bacterium]|nr:aspartate aminotransferase family protein [Blastocatellia bacterium]
MSDRYYKSRTLTQQSAHSIAGGAGFLERQADTPLVFVRAQGNRLWDADDNEYIDHHSAFGAHLLGHNHPEANAAVRAAMERGLSLMGSGPTLEETRLAELLCAYVPSMERVQFTSTGNEAITQAIRLSRAWTCREDIIVMLGGYNGWHNDASHALMPSLEAIGPRQVGAYQFVTTPTDLPADVRRHVHVVNFNDLLSVEYVMQSHPIACVITEPALQNIGVVPAQAGYLAALRRLCDQYGALLVLDEVRSGFRTSLGGYQSVVGIKPDLTVLGKTIANGYPLGVIGGRASVMALFDSPDPSWCVALNGTFNTHPLTVAAALATLNILQRDADAVYQRLEMLGARLQTGLEMVFAELGVTATVSRLGAAFCVYFCDHVPTDWHDLMAHHDFALDRRYRRGLIERGIYQFPLPCKQGSLSTAHTREDISQTIAATRAILQA